MFAAITIQAEVLGAMLVTIVAACVFVLWFLLERAQARYYDRRALRTCFHCVKCSTIYSALGRIPAANCPRCGFENGRLRF